MKEITIGVVIVTYNPDIELFNKVLNSLKEQVNSICIVDNGSKNKNEILNFKDDNISIVPLDENEGIATATNIGLKFYIEKKYDFILTSDQDSVYPKDYIINLKKNLELKEMELKQIAAFAPVFFDENEKKLASIIIRTKLFPKKIQIYNDFVDVFQAIASGLIFNVEVLKEVGLMNEELFIDWVDLEWCWKANYNAKRVVCCKNLQITHRLGDYAKDIGYRKVSMRSYIRNYYITRNSFYLALHTPYLSFCSKVILFLKSFQYIVGYTVLSDDHLRNFVYTNKGLFDALKGKMGKIDNVN